MPTRKRTLTDEPEWNNRPINTSRKKGYKCDTKILKTIETTLQHMLNDHELDRIFISHQEVRYPKDYKINDNKTNQHFRSAQGKLIKHLERKGYSPHYISVREQDADNPHHHYHTFLCVDERKCQSSASSAFKMNDFWASSIGRKGAKGLVQDVSKGGKGHKLKTSSDSFEKDYDAVFRHISYIAKENTKKKNNKKRELFSSNLKHEITDKKRKR